MVNEPERILRAYLVLKTTKREPECGSDAEHYVRMQAVGMLKGVSNDEDSHKNGTGTNDFKESSLFPINS